MPIVRNPRHEKFSQMVASGIKPQEAYVSLGYSANGAAQSANNLLNRTDVRERVNEILSLVAQSTAEQVAFDQQRVLNRLDVLSRRAQELNQITAAVRAEELIGKERGMFVERSDSKHRVITLNDVPLEVLQARRDELAARLPPEIREALDAWTEKEAAKAVNGSS